MSGGEYHLPLYGITDKKQDGVNNNFDRQLRCHRQQENAAGHQQGAGQHLDNCQCEIADGGAAFGDLAPEYQPVIDQEIVGGGEDPGQDRSGARVPDASGPFQQGYKYGEQDQVQHCGGQGGEHEQQELPAEDTVDPDRILNGIEMRGMVVLGIIDRLNGKLPDGTAAFGIQQHLHLELETFSRCIDQLCHKVPGDTPQAGLGICDLQTGQQPADLPCQLVAEGALPGDPGAVKVPAAQDQVTAMGQHDLPAAMDILRHMLTVGIRGDTAPHVRPGAQTIIEGILQGPAFPHIYIVGQNGTSQLHGLRVQAVIGRAAAVIDDHDLIFIFRCQPAQQRDHPFIRFIGRNDQGDYRPLTGRDGRFLHIGHRECSLLIIKKSISSSPFLHFWLTADIPYRREKDFPGDSAKAELFRRIAT